MLQLGIRLHDAGIEPLEQLLPKVRAQGFTCCHIALSKSLPGTPCTPGALTPGYAQYVKNAFAQAGLGIAVLGNYLNLLNPDEDYQAWAAQMYTAHIRFAALLGCGMVGTETGCPNREYAFVPACREEKTLAQFVRRLTPIVRCAESYGVTLAIEPVVRHSVWGPEACRKVLDEIGSPNLQVIFDPVNLLDDANVGHCQELFARFLELLGPDIAAVHLKDYKHGPDGRLVTIGVGAGLGEMDYAPILRYLKAEKPYVYATLEDSTPADAQSSAAFIRRAYEQAPVMAAH